MTYQSVKWNLFFHGRSVFPLHLLYEVYNAVYAPGIEAGFPAQHNSVSFHLPEVIAL